MRNAIIILIFAAIAVSFANDVSAYGVGRLGSKFSNQGSLGSKKAVPQPTGDVLMVDGVSLILQTDAASFICRAGGC